MSTSDEHWNWIEAIQADGRGLTTWEEERVEEWRQRIESGRPLSERQAEILERIYAEKTP